MSPRPCIDIGHGGDNHGTEAGDFIEKAITLEVGLLLQEILVALNSPPVLTRSCDVALTQEERGQVSRQHACDLVLSLHCNANVDPRAHGAELYVNEANGAALAWAAGAMPHLRAVIGQCRVVPLDMEHLEEWQRNAAAIICAHEATTVVCELGFRTHPEDRALLMSDNGRRAIACALAAAIFNNMKG